MAEETKILSIYEEIEDLQTQLTQRSKGHFDASLSQWRLANQLQADDKLFEAFVAELKEEFTCVYELACEANAIAIEMQRHVVYTVILQTPVVYLKPNERTINDLCEPAVQVNRTGCAPQIWSAEKFKHRLNQMRDLQQRWKAAGGLSDSLKRSNPFYDQEAASLLGVANIHLRALFFNSKLDYVVPIIDTRGQTTGSLHVVLDHTGSSTMKPASDLHINSTLRGSMSEGICVDTDEQSLGNRSASQHSFEDEGIEEPSNIFDGKSDQITVKFAIREARDLPAPDADRVLCRYTFINPKLDQTAVSIKRSDEDNHESKSHTFSFNHEMEYTFPITEAFRSTCLTKSISVELWSQYDPAPSSPEDPKSVATDDDDDDQQQLLRIRDMGHRWKDVRRHLQFSVEIRELDVTGQWKPVQVDAHDGILSGGIYRLKQAQSKRLVVQLRVLPRANAMSLSVYAIRSIELGSVSMRKIDAPVQLDSYQEKDLQSLKEQWLSLIEKRKHLVEQQLHTLNQQTEKATSNTLRESMLLNSLLQLAEEQDVAVLPPQGSGIPGAPAGWNPPPAIEVHRPMMFLNIDPFKLTPAHDPAGMESTLIDEDPSKMKTLSLVHGAVDPMRAISVWNPTTDEFTALNQVTRDGFLVYLIVKITVIISEPVHMELVLRKRIAVTVGKGEGWWAGKALKNILGHESYTQTSVVYEMVSNVPKSLYAVEDQTRLDLECVSKENIERYLHSASAIDSLLLLDRLRQDVLLAENFAKQQTLCKATSAPDITSAKRKKAAPRLPVPSQADSSSKEETQPAFDYAAMHSSNPSIASRQSFIDEQRVDPVGTPPRPIKQMDLLEVDPPSEEYAITPADSAESLSRRAPDEETQIYALGSRVVINTGHSIVQKAGTVRYFGELSRKAGYWYGIELEEPLGKNNGSLNGHPYFECANNHGVFVRSDKIQNFPSRPLSAVSEDVDH